MSAIRPTWGEVFDAPPGTTGDDLLRLPDDGYKYELFEGMLVREMTSPEHGAICHRLDVELGIYAKAVSLPNQIVQSALFDVAPPGAPSGAVFAPDLAIRRVGAPSTWAVPQEAPLLAVEVVSPSQTLAEIALKAQTYRNAGVEEVWVVDARSRSVQIWTAQGMATLDETQALTSPLLPGFSVPVRFLLDG
jgi:Uma2 family endonuclease